MSTTLLRVGAVLSMTGLTRSALYRLVSAGSFPAPISLAHTRARCWVSDEVQGWIQQQVSAARAAEHKELHYEAE